MSRHLSLAIPCTTFGLCWREVFNGLGAVADNLQAGSIPLSPTSGILAEPAEHIATILGEPVTLLHLAFFVIGLCLPQLLELLLAVRELLAALAHLLRRAATAIRATNFVARPVYLPN